MGEERKVNKVLVGKPEEITRKTKAKMGRWDLTEISWGYGVDSTGSG
jgi:hypothetical protein